MKQPCTVVKIGGNILDDSAALDAFLDAFADLEGAKILIHGGGKIATAVGARLGIEPKYVDGRRITDTPTLELVTMVYGGTINKGLTAALQSRGCNAIGLTGADGNLLHAVKRPVAAAEYLVARRIDARGGAPHPRRPRPHAQHQRRHHGECAGPGACAVF